ncbi:MAG: class B sortase [Oscillospiraceae bacterium]|nr:class B sortase [Oscillospiraceae bacterium]
MSKETEELIGSEDMDASAVPDSDADEATRTAEEMPVTEAPEEKPEETEDPDEEDSEETEESDEEEDSEETEESDEEEVSEETEESDEEEESEETEESDEEEESEETEESDEAEESEKPTENAPLNEKIMAIKSALWVQEDERQQAETKLQIADKVKKYKSGIETGEQPEHDAAVPVQDAQKSAKEAAPDKKHGKKKSKKKKAKKKQKNSVFPRKGDKPLDVVRKCVFLASSAIFVLCLALIVEYFWNNHYNSNLNENLSNMYQETKPPKEQEQETTEPPAEEYEYFGFLPNAERLLEINPDVAGWISIPGTDVSYPVLQRRGNPDGNEYYLKRNIYLEDAHAGSIFMDYRNDFDYVIDGKKQLANSANLIIYGHNMHDYSMFGSLKHYINDANYYGEHPIVELNSNYRKYQYKIFAMIIVDINDQSDTRFDYWNQLEFADEKAFYDYVNEIKRRTIRLNDVDVKYGDELLTLSTCNSTFSDGRLVVFARKVREGEDLYAGTQTSTANPNIKWPNSYYRWNKSTYDPEAEFVPYG